MAGGATTEFRVGRVLSRSFAIFFRNIIPFGMIAALMTAPYFGFQCLVLRGDVRMASGASDMIGEILQTLFANVATAAISYGAFQELRGRHVGMGQSLARGLRLIFPVLGVAFLSWLLTILGFFLLIVPGLIVLTMLWVAVPVAVVERPGVAASLNRSADLTKGYRWPIFGIILILWAIMVVAGIIAMTAILGAAGLETFGEITTVPALVVEAAILAAATALGSVMSAVVYHDLRAAKEGISIEDIAKVFD